MEEEDNIQVVIRMRPVKEEFEAVRSITKE